MSTPLEFDTSPDQAILPRSRSRLSIVTSIRRRTSRLFNRNVSSINIFDGAAESAAGSTADNTPQPIQPVQKPIQPVEPKSLKTKRSWFHSVGTRFHRHDQAARESSESSQDVHVELEEAVDTTTPPSSPSSPESPPSPSAVRRRSLRSRLRFPSLPTRFRRRKTPSLSRSSSLSDEDKENLAGFAPPPHHANVSNTGSWSSFRSGVQRAVREMVDGNFRFSDDRGARNAPTRPPTRMPLRTLWTIMSADSSEGQTSQSPPTPPESPRKTYRLSSPTWSPSWSPDQSPTSPKSPNCIFLSPSARSQASDSGLTHSGSTPESSPIRSPASKAPSLDSVEVFASPVEGQNMHGEVQEEGDRSGREIEVVDHEAVERGDGDADVLVSRRMRDEGRPLVVPHRTVGF